jgi:hypothetical protein
VRFKRTAVVTRSGWSPPNTPQLLNQKLLKRPGRLGRVSTLATFPASRQDRDVHPGCQGGRQHDPSGEEPAWEAHRSGFLGLRQVVTLETVRLQADQVRAVRGKLLTRQLAASTGSVKSEFGVTLAVELAEESEQTAFVLARTIRRG